MAIESLSNAWFLHGAGMTYALFLDAQGRLHHSHWGASLRATDLAGRRPRRERAFSPNPPDLPRAFSVDTQQAEFPTGGTGDFRQPSLEIQRADGTRGLDLRYESHRILPGKPTLDGLPSTYVEDAAEAETLELVLADRPGGLRVILSYTVFADRPVLTRTVRLENTSSQPISIERILSVSLDLPEDGAERWLHLSGAWARERCPSVRTIHPGLQSIESRRGTSSHQHHPFLCLLDRSANETSGQVWGASLVYSGNFLGSVERDSHGLTRLQLGLNPAGFRWQIDPGAAFQAPEVVLVYSAQGLGGMSHAYHELYRTRLCRGPFRDRDRPVLINNWEATYFGFTEQKLLDLAGAARALGVDLFVLDDGWFGHRDDDTTSLGDWTPHPAKFPRGLRPFVDQINAFGLDFGLWLEPEMVSPDSELYRAHPDWVLHEAGRAPALARGQLVLDLSRSEVVDSVYESLVTVLGSAPITYVKWDMNRHLTDIASASRAADRQGETAHRYVLGLYQLLERLRTRFPAVLWEGCSGGGGRFDPGILHFMPQIWTSDNTDAIARLEIQRGTSLVYPLSTMAAHISEVPNHQNHRTTPLATRFFAGTLGAFGLELDLAKLSPTECAEIALCIERYKRWSPLIRTGTLHRLAHVAEDGMAAWSVVAPDRSAALVVVVTPLVESNPPLRRICPRGLDPSADYRDTLTGTIHPGDLLMSAGLLFSVTSDFAAHAWHLERIEPQA